MAKAILDESLIGTAGYVQYEYVDAPLKHLLRQPTLSYQGQGLILSASSWHCANRTCLFLLSAAASRGDQILNANSFAKQGFSKVLEEEALSDDSLFDAINDLYLNRNSYIQAMEQSSLNNAA